jgi:hypothetical protein
MFDCWVSTQASLSCYGVMIRSRPFLLPSLRLLPVAPAHPNRPSLVEQPKDDDTSVLLAMQHSSTSYRELAE